jgi:hypothetical protein
VPTEQVPVICVHPYSIDAEETTENVIKDPIRNTLFFQITEDDFSIGHKRYKKTKKINYIFISFFVLTVFELLEQKPFNMI